MKQKKKRWSRWLKLLLILIFARIKDFGCTAVKPKPKYLKKAVPVSGNGNTTD